MADGHRDLVVFRRAYGLAMSIYRSSVGFPRSEMFSLTNQMRRSSRGVAANIAEAFRKRRYPNLLANRLTDADGEVAETLVWIDFAADCGYLDAATARSFRDGYDEVGRMLGAILRNPAKYRPRPE